MELPIKLKSVTKTGATTTWEVWTEGPKVFKRWGQKKLQIVEYTATPKNVGRKNATTAEEQAILEARSAATLQLKKGYTNFEEQVADTTVEEDQSTEQEVKEEYIPHILPMLAKDYNKDFKHIKFPCTVQPKLDGVRMLCNSKGEMWSRMGTLRPNNDTVRAQIIKLYSIAKEKGCNLDTVILDGEQYNTEESFQTLVGKVKATKDKKDELIPYHIFDIYDSKQPDLTFHKRAHILYRVIDVIIKEHKLLPLHVTWCAPALDKDAIFTEYNRYMELGYEGIIIRNNAGVYRPKHRSFDLQKFKEFQTDEFKIVGYTKASGTQEGAIMFEVLAKDWIKGEGQKSGIFKCGFTGHIDTRREMYLHGNDYVGKMLTIKYQELSKDMIPRFPVGISIRDYE